MANDLHQTAKKRTTTLPETTWPNYKSVQQICLRIGKKLSMIKNKKFEKIYILS